MNKINELDIAELKVQMLTMYKHVGYTGSLQCLYEILTAAIVLLDVINEEIHNDGV